MDNHSRESVREVDPKKVVHDFVRLPDDLDRVTERIREIDQGPEGGSLEQGDDDALPSDDGAGQRRTIAHLAPPALRGPVPTLDQIAAGAEALRRARLEPDPVRHGSHSGEEDHQVLVQSWGPLGPCGCDDCRGLRERFRGKQRAEPNGRLGRMAGQLRSALPRIR